MCTWVAIGLRRARAPGRRRHAPRRALGKQSVLYALGPEGEAAEINGRLSSIEIRDVRIRAPKGWPTNNTLRDRRIVIVPDLRELPSDRVRVTREILKNPSLRHPDKSIGVESVWDDGAKRR
jgi:hypothetical protein